MEAVTSLKHFLDHESLLFIVNHFYALRNDLDIQFEEIIVVLLRDQNDDKQNKHLLVKYIDELNELRQVILDELNRNETACIRNYEANSISAKSNRSGFLYDAKCELENLCMIHEQHPTMIRLDDLVRDRSIRLKAHLLMNKTFLLKEFRYRLPFVDDEIKLSKLLIIDDVLDDDEVNFLR